MTRYLTITLTKAGVSCRARLLDEQAPHTCEAVWNALPQEGDAFHAKYARNEVYTLLPASPPPRIGKTPRSHRFPATCACSTSSRGRSATPPTATNRLAAHHAQGATDLALFYGRNNLLINGDLGWVPGNVFATIEDGLAEIAAACNTLWLRGVEGETLAFARAD